MWQPRYKNKPEQRKSALSLEWKTGRKRKLQEQLQQPNNERREKSVSTTAHNKGKPTKHFKAKQFTYPTNTQN